MRLAKKSHCKVNLLLNVLGKRADGFHDLETIMQPIGLYDALTFECASTGIHLTCSNPALPVDGSNLVHKAATAFLEATKIPTGVRIHLDKHIPMAAGLGGGSGNAAVTLLALNELFELPLSPEKMTQLASRLGSDVPFFLQSKPAVATGRGERVQALEPFTALAGCAFLLIHPDFGVSTPWAYQNLSHFPEAVNGQAGRANAMLALLQGSDSAPVAKNLYNSLEAPVLEKYPILRLFKDFLLAEGALGALMSGSGSTTFALTRDLAHGLALREKFLAKFGSTNWMAVLPIAS